MGREYSKAAEDIPNLTEIVFFMVHEFNIYSRAHVNRDFSRFIAPVSRKASTIENAV